MELQQFNCKQQACFIISNSNVTDIRDSASRVSQSIHSIPNMDKVFCYGTGTCHLPQVLFMFVNSTGCLLLQYSIHTSFILDICLLMDLLRHSMIHSPLFLLTLCLLQVFFRDMRFSISLHSVL